MSHGEPVEPSAVIVPSASRLPSPKGPPEGPTRWQLSQPSTGRRLVPLMVRALTGGNLATLSALAVVAIAAARAAVLAGRPSWPGGGTVRRAAENPVHRTTPGGGVQISWTHVEVRWPSEE